LTFIILLFAIYRTTIDTECVYAAGLMRVEFFYRSLLYTMSVWL